LARSEGMVYMGEETLDIANKAAGWNKGLEDA